MTGKCAVVRGHYGFYEDLGSRWKVVVVRQLVLKYIILEPSPFM
jgi:hypothetical protein